jgi:hypothetical protein
MGYNYYVPTVAVKPSARSASAVTIDVTVQQIGVAPFYYDLGLGLRCAGINKRVLAGVDTLIDKDSIKVFSFTGIPATKACLDSISISLESSYAYSGRPIKFAQGTGALTISLPLPPTSSNSAAVNPRPVAAPVRRPAAASAASVPRPAPARQPARSPVRSANAVGAPDDNQVSQSSLQFGNLFGSLFTYTSKSSTGSGV